MTPRRLTVGYIPLTDAAPLIVAHELGFAREEGLSLDLVRCPSWAALRDLLAFGHIEAAHMLSPLPIAMTLGIGGVAAPVSALQVLSVNGTVVGVGRALAGRLDAARHDFAFDDAAAAGRALLSGAGRTLRIGVPFPVCMHAELLDYWLTALGADVADRIAVRTVPPPQMADALRADEIDAFCVGEPWGSACVEAGVGALLLPGRAIWSFAPEKVLAVRTEWAAASPEIVAALMRAVWRACRWLAADGAATTAAELMARATYLGIEPHVVDRALTGRLTVTARGDLRDCPGFVTFFDGAAPFPWKSQAAWIGARLARRLGRDPAATVDAARAVYRTDLYRANLGPAGAILPGASQKVEGGIAEGTAVAAGNGRLILRENRFFDGRVFDPTAPG